MEISRAKHFWYVTDEKLYKSKDLSKIREIDEYSNDLIGVYGVVETEKGDKLIKVEFNYSGEPILIGGIMGTFLHEDSFLRLNSKEKIIEV